MPGRSPDKMTGKTTIFLEDYQPPRFFIDSVELDFRLGEEETRVRSTLSVRRNGDHAHPLVLDGEALTLTEIEVDGAAPDPADYRLNANQLILDTRLQSLVLTTEVTIRPQDNTTLSGLYRSSGNFCTQCEAEGFRRITYFPDRPDVLARYRTIITANKDSYPVLLSNGNLVEHSEIGDGVHRAVWDDPFPKPSYLFALVAGDLACISDRFTTCSGRRVDLHIYTQHHNADKCGHAMASLKKAMKWDEEVYGREYDLDQYMIVAVDDFNMGAMENKGLNIFNSRYVLASPDTATDADYEAIESVIAHEYFHNWSGNRVTCRDWFQLSLKEGFTVFRDQEFSADMGSRGVQRVRDVNVMRVHQFQEDSGPLAHPVRPGSYQEINNFYTVTVYNKGAEVVRMLHTLVGVEGFRRGTDHYFRTYDGQAVTTDDFLSAMERQNNIDLSQFRRWYDQAGTPVLRLTTFYNATARKYELHVEQSCPPTPGQPQKLPFHIPLTVALLAANGDCFDLDRGGSKQSVLAVSAERESFTFDDIPSRPILSVLRGFSAPVKIEYEYSEEELYFLLVNDTDPFARWEAAQRLAVNILLDMVQALQQDQSPRVDSRYIEAAHSLLRSEEEDRAMLTQLLTPPSEAYVSEFLDIVDPDAVWRARSHLRAELGRTLWDALREVYDDLAGGTCENTQDSMGRRSLRNICLDYLCSTGDAAATTLAREQYTSADNMTDTMAALVALNDTPSADRELCLESFYSTWKDENLVVDKWLALRAGSRLPDTLDRVLELTGHESFNLQNPNRVRSLIGVFAHRNPARFHDRSGRGYEFVAGYVGRLDQVNPQVAARLATAFNTWRRYDVDRQEKISVQLKGLLDRPGLSSDVEEIVTKALA